jgi:phosphate transport system substrate-binding protein
MYLKRPPGKPVDQKVKEFMRYILSQEGQDAVAKHNVYLPLTPELVREQRAKLD